MKHPLKEQQKNQQKFLEQLPEDQREDYAQIFRIGNAAYCYHIRADELKPTEQDFKDWIQGLPKHIGEDMKTKGFENCKGVVSFTRFVMEKNDIGMGEWMKAHLHEADFREYCAQKSARES